MTRQPETPRRSGPRTPLLAQPAMRYRSGAPAEVQAEKTGPRNGIEKLTSMSYVPPRYLYHRFLRSIGLDPVEAGRRTWLPWTRNYIEGWSPLYSDRNYPKALGASFGLEYMAIPMWDQLIPGLDPVFTVLRVRDSSISFRTRATRESLASCSRVSGSSSCGSWPQGALRRPRRNRPHACSTNRTSLPIPRSPLSRRTSCCSTSSRRRTGRRRARSSPATTWKPGSTRSAWMPTTRFSRRSSSRTGAEKNSCAFIVRTDRTEKATGARSRASRSARRSRSPPIGTRCAWRTTAGRSPERIAPRSRSRCRRVPVSSMTRAQHSEVTGRCARIRRSTRGVVSAG